MANNTITFDPPDGVAYDVNLVINTGADFKSTFHVLNNDRTDFDFSTSNAVGLGTTTGWTGSSQMTKSVSVGSSAYAAGTFTVGFTSAAGGKFNISMGSTDTRSLNGGRYWYDVLVSSGSTIYRIVQGNILVKAGVSSAP